MTTVTASILAVSAFAQNSEVGRRAENQQDRIANGIATNRLSAGQTAHLERGEARINRETRRERARNGGHLTAREKGRINRQQNRMSRRIYRDKHS